MRSTEKLANDLGKYFGNIEVGKNSMSKADLESFAKIAAEDFLRNKIPLNKSLANIYKEQPQLNPNHIRRIAEMSNNEVHDNLFRTSEDKNIQFELADADQVLGEKPVEKIARDNREYYRSPKVVEIEKTASSSEMEMVLPFNADPKKTMLNIGEKLIASKEELESEKLASALNLENEYSKLFTMLSTELQEESFPKISSALLEASDDRQIFSNLVTDLLRDGYTEDELSRGHYKTAGLKVNSSHPLINQYDRVIKIAQKLSVTCRAIELLDADIARVNDVLRG